MDGASDLTVLLRIVLPLIKAVLATIVLFASVGYWNDFFSALLYLNDPSKQPLTIYLRKIFFAKYRMNPSLSTDGSARHDRFCRFHGKDKDGKHNRHDASHHDAVSLCPKILRSWIMIGAVKG